jgi:hypothetical protein
MLTALAALTPGVKLASWRIFIACIAALLIFLGTVYEV